MKHLTRLLLVLLAVSMTPLVSSAATDADSAGIVAEQSLPVMPSSPAFALMGLEPESIIEPSSPTDIAVTILDQTDDLSALPRNFALAVTPFMLGGGKYGDYKEWRESGRLGQNLLRTFRLSIAASTRTDTLPDSGTIESTSLGIGFVVDLVRGRIEPSPQQRKLDTAIMNLNGLLTRNLFEAESNDPEYKAISDSIFELAITKSTLEHQAASSADSQRVDSLNSAIAALEQSASQRSKKLMEQIFADSIALNEQIERLAKELPNRRVGFKLALAGGAVWDFPGRVAGDGELTRWGAWTTFGYSGTRLGIFGIGRILGHDQSEDEALFDFGGSLKWESASKISISGEALYRNFFNRDTDKDTWRMALNASYPIAANKALSLTFGRDFEGNKTGNLLAMINLILGFGAQRPLPQN